MLEHLKRGQKEAGSASVGKTAHWTHQLLLEWATAAEVKKGAWGGPVPSPSSSPTTTALCWQSLREEAAGKAEMGFVKSQLQHLKMSRVNLDGEIKSGTTHSLECYRRI